MIRYRAAQHNLDERFYYHNILAGSSIYSNLEYTSAVFIEFQVVAQELDTITSSEEIIDNSA
jgi:hypothetical protein